MIWCSSLGFLLLSESNESLLFFVSLSTKEARCEFNGTSEDDDDTRLEEADVALCRSSRRCSRPALSMRLAVLSDMMLISVVCWKFLLVDDILSVTLIKISRSLMFP